MYAHVSFLGFPEEFPMGYNYYCVNVFVVLLVTASVCIWHCHHAVFCGEVFILIWSFLIRAFIHPQTIYIPTENVPTARSGRQ